MPFSRFSKLTSVTPEPIEEWDDFAALFTAEQIVYTDNKHAPPLYSPAEFLPDSRRAAANVVSLGAIVADLDDATPTQVGKIVNRLKKAKREFIVHTTHSHATAGPRGKWKGRIIIPFNRPVWPFEWGGVWEYMQEHVFDGLMDPACRDFGHMYFFPSAPDEDLPEEGRPQLGRYEGEFFPVPQIEADEDEDEFDGIDTPDPALIARIDIGTRTAIARQLLDSVPPAVSGQHGDLQTFQAACIGRDCALEAEDFWPLLVEYNKRCEPPWNEHDLRTKLRSAYKTGKMPMGWRLVDKQVDDHVTAKDVSKKITKLLNNPNESIQTDGRSLRHVLKGEPFVSQDQMVAVARRLARLFPHADPSQVAALFDDAIKQTQNLRDCTLDMFAGAIDEEQSALTARKAELEALAMAAETDAIRRAWNYVECERSTPYTKEERKKWMQEFDPEAKTEHYHVLRMNTQFWFRVGETYCGPFGQDEAMTRALELLPPAKLELHRTTAAGERVPLGHNALVAAYGEHVDHVIVDLNAQVTRYDRKRRTITLASCPFREDIMPRERPVVAQWLRLLVKGQENPADEPVLVQHIEDWLACIRELNYPTACLALVGKRGTGKSLLAEALARGWGRQPTELGDVLQAGRSNFNTKLADCPVVAADEGPPTDWRGYPDTQGMRRITTEHSRTFNRKFKDPAECRGCIRLVMSANSLEGKITHPQQHLSEDDVDALVERFLYVPVETTAAAKFINSLPPEDSEAFREGTWIIEHALWLREQTTLEEIRERSGNHRMLVAGLDDGPLRTHLTISSGERNNCCHWLAEYILNPNKLTPVPGTEPPMVVPPTKRYPRAALLVTAYTLYTHWAEFCVDRPALGQIERSLGGLSERRQRGAHKYRSIDLDVVRAWATANGRCSDATFDEALRGLALL